MIHFPKLPHGNLYTGKVSNGRISNFRECFKDILHTLLCYIDDYLIFYIYTIVSYSVFF